MWPPDEVECPACDGDALVYYCEYCQEREELEEREAKY